MATTRKSRLRSPRLVYDIEMLRAMADETRQRILQFLCTPGAGEMRYFPVNAIADSFDLTASTVSHHLRILRQADLVEMRRSGKERLYRLNLGRLKSNVGQFYDLLNLVEDARARNEE